MMINSANGHATFGNRISLFDVNRYLPPLREEPEAHKRRKTFEHLLAVWLAYI
jgi:hypothetical protein